MNEILRRACEEFGEVVAISVFAEFDPAPNSGAVGRCDEWMFVFRSGSFCVSVNVDDDSILLTEREPSFPLRIRLTDERSWGTLTGSQLSWGWTLENQRGYTDGVQLEFASEGRSRTIQLMAEASLLTPHRVDLLDYSAV